MARLILDVRPLLALSLMLFAGCLTDVSESGPFASGRGVASEAALEHGTCQDACGGASADGCWCDDLCATYGDCCQDYEAACVESDPKCFSDGDCGEGERCDVATSAPDGGPCCPPGAFCIAIMPACSGSCVADDVQEPCAMLLCVEGYLAVDHDGDGCDDACQPTDGPTCEPLECLPGQAPVDVDGDGCGDTCDPSGCQADEDCDGDFFCKRPSGQCYAEGTCAPKADTCMQVYAPVCGCDGVTYPNSCQADGAGASVSHEGECAPPSNNECSSDADCADNQQCQPIQCITAPCPPGICEDNAAPAGDSCQDACGGSSSDESCWCDAYCSAWGDCCEDFSQQCSE